MKHTLKADGAAFNTNGTRVDKNSTAGSGFGLCSCGELSETLPSRAARKRWFAEHKAAAENQTPFGTEPVNADAPEQPIVEEVLSDFGKKTFDDLESEPVDGKPMTKADAFALVRDARFAIRGGDSAIKDNDAARLRKVADEIKRAGDALLAALDGPGVKGLK